jgi:GT2 family glycosyltransferase
MSLIETPQTGLSIVIPSWNGRALLERFLPSVASAAAAYEAACRQPTEILVADDASEDGTPEWLARNYPRLRCEPSARRQGFGPTANRGIRAASYGLVFLLNNDVALEPATLPPLAAHFHSPGVFAVAGQVYDYQTGLLSGAGQLGRFRRGFLEIHRRYFVAGTSEAGGPPWLTLFTSGGSSLFDREKFLALGGFEDLLAPFGWEDVELSLRAWKQGYELHYEPRSAVWHQFSSTISPGFRRRYVRAIYERNRLLGHWLHLDSRGEFAAQAFALSGKLLASTLVGRWEAWSALRQALSFRSEIRVKRKSLQTRRQRVLHEVLQQVAQQLERPGARLLDRKSAPTRACPSSPVASAVRDASSQSGR